MEELIPNYTKEDFLESTAPYEWLAHFKDDRLKLKQMTTIMSAKASAVKVRNFVAMFKAYMEGVNAKNAAILQRDGVYRPAARTGKRHVDL